MPRDVFRVRALKWIIELYNSKVVTSDDLIWISFFFSNFGWQETNKLKEEIYIQAVDHITFNSLSFLPNFQHTNKIKENIETLTNELKDFQLLKDIDLWKQNETYLLFFNMEFFQVFLFELESFTKNYKEALGDYANTLNIYLIKGFEKVLEKIKETYPYLPIDIDSFMSNPFFNYWNAPENKVRIEIILNGLFELFRESSTTDNIPKQASNLADQALNYYFKYFDGKSKYTDLGAKQSMNKIVSRFEDYPDIRKHLKRFRILMDTNVKEGLSEIKNYLTLLARSNG